MTGLEVGLPTCGQDAVLIGGAIDRQSEIVAPVDNAIEDIARSNKRAQLTSDAFWRIEFDRIPS